MGISNVDAQGVYTDQGIRTQYGLILPPGARVAAYVRSTGVQNGDDAFLAQNLVQTLAAGLARARAGFGDFVVCLPGHAENVSDATTFSGALLAGTKIVGIGKGSNTPTFSWTATAAQWAVNKADITITGLRFNFNLAGNVTNAILVSGADCGIYYNEFIVSGAAGAATNSILLAVGADRTDITGNIFRGLAATAVTSCIGNTGAVSDIRICDNEITCSASSAFGAITISFATIGHKILRNVVTNTTAASVAGIGYGNVACTGQCAFNTISVLSTGAHVSGTTGIAVGGVTNKTGFFQNFSVNDPNVSGILMPAADT